MIVFMDSSALIKRYINEVGTSEVNLIFEKADDVIISPVTMIEIASAFKRRYFEKSINHSDYDYLKQIVEQESEDFSKLVFDRSLEEKSKDLIDKYQLRTLDSIQLASMIISKSNLFVTSDKKLARSAKREGIKTDLI